MSDDERATIGAKHRDSVPRAVHSPDSEPTPMPSEPPSPEAVAGFAELPPAAQECLRQQHNSLRELDVATARMWGSRHASDELGKLNVELTAIAERVKPLEGVPELLRMMSVAITEVRGEIKPIAAAVPEISAKLQRLEIDQNVAKVERASLVESLQSQKIRVVKDDEVAAGIHTDIEKRVRSLETSRSWMKGVAYALAVVWGLVVVCVGWLLKRKA